MSSIVLKLVAHTDARLKVVWCEGGDIPLCFEAYFVYRSQIDQCAQECRKLLNALVESYLQGAYDRYAEILRNLARQGSNLFYLLFDGAAENREYAASVIKPWLASLEEGSRMTIFSDASLNVPWNVLFDGDERNVPATSVDLADYSAFWAFKYKLAVLYGGMAPKFLRIPRDRSTFKALSILNREIFDHARGLLTPNEVDTLESYLLYPEGSAQTTEECKSKWALLEKADCLLYFFTHASGVEIKLSSQDTLNVVDLKRKFLDPRRRGSGKIPEALIVLNGCNTGVGKLDSSFMTATSEAGCCGFIGTEADLPTRFAIRFGMGLLHRILFAGESALEALDEMRRQHWPLGMLYTCYSHPDFRVSPDPQSKPDPTPRPLNLSFEG
jgi:hypothetical protein